MTTNETTPAEWARDGGQQISNLVDSDLGPSIVPAAGRDLAALDAEAALVGSLLHLPAPAALDALDLVTTEDFADLRLSVLAGVCQQLVAAGADPDPVLVLAHVRRHAIVTGVDAVKTMTLLLAELYGSVPVPASWRHYLLAVLDGALRRRCVELAVRIGQAAEGESIGSLVALVDREAQAVRELAARRAPVADDHPTRLRAVGI